MQSGSVGEVNVGQRIEADKNVITTVISYILV